MTAAFPASPLPLIPTADPVLPLPSLEEMEGAIADDPRAFSAYLEDREEQIRLRKSDPFRHGYEPAIWHVVDDLLCRGVKVKLVDPTSDVPAEIMGGSEVFVSGGNRAGKTQYAASRVIRKLVNKAWQRAWCFHTNGPSSIAMQQPRLYEYLPRQWKTIGKARHGIADIKFSIKNGFTGDPPGFVGPNGSQCFCKNYAQKIGTVEGDEIDIVWMDELVPMDFIEAVRFRLATRNGDLLITFTAVEGYTATVKTLLNRAQDVLTVPAPMLPLVDATGRVTGHERVPRVQQAAYPDLKIVYFHIRDNPFGNPPEVEKRARANGREGILLRCYGVPTKQIGAQFPTFRKEVHTITQAQFERLCPEGTNQHYVDPCSGRNWAMLWARALPDEQTIVVYRERPCPGIYVQGVGDPGDWAEPDGEKPDGKHGPAQKPWGFGHERNIEEMLRAEGWRDDEIKGAIARADCATLPKRSEIGDRRSEVGGRRSETELSLQPSAFNLQPLEGGDAPCCPSENRPIGSAAPTFEPKARPGPHSTLNTEGGDEPCDATCTAGGLPRPAQNVPNGSPLTPGSAAPTFQPKARPGPEEIFERLMDSRFGAAPTVTRTETKTLIESMAEAGMEFEPAPGEHQREGIDQINDLLYYDPEQPIGPANKPRLIIVETCRNTIWALENWTGLDGQHGACKDFIDLLRYMALAPPQYVTAEMFRCYGGGSY